MNWCPFARHPEVDGFVEYVKEQWKQFLQKEKETKQASGSNL